MNSLQQILDTALDGFELTVEEKNAILGIFFLQYFKSQLELLCSIKGQDESFNTQLQSFFTSAIATLTPEEKTNFETTMNEEKGRILKDLLDTFSAEFPQDLKQKLQDNLKHIM